MILLAKADSGKPKAGNSQAEQLVVEKPSNLEPIPRLLPWTDGSATIFGSENKHPENSRLAPHNSRLFVKILYISTERGWHGGEEQLRLLAEGARRKGHECRIAARASGRFAARMQGAGFPMILLPGSARNLRTLWRLRQAMRDFAPDIIHANDPHGLAIARVASVPWLGPFLGELPPSGHIASRRVLFGIRSVGKYLAWCDRVICVSHAIARVCQEAGIPPEMLRVVHSGIDPERMAGGDAARGRQSLGVSADLPLVLCVGQLAHYKGHHHLIEAMATVKKTFPKAVLVLAGDGPLRKKLQQLAENLGIRASVKFLGYCTDIPDLISACDLFVLASPAEGLGTSVLDAMFAEKPVVGADAGGIPEMLGPVDDRPTVGWLVPPNDSAALACAITEALGSEQLRQEYGIAGRARAERGFSAEQMVRNMLAVYHDVAACGLAKRLSRKRLDR